MQQSINGKDASRMPCCGIYALAELSGRSLQFVFDWYKEKYNRPANWKGSSYKRMTVRKFVDEYTAKGKTYLLMTGSHFLVIKGGRNEAICIDQGARCSVDNYYGKNKKVRRAVQIGGRR